jgi:hypothetical protein
MTTNSTTTPPALPPALFCGSTRSGPRARWRCLLRGASSDREALEQLRQATAAERFVDLTVLPEGRRPDDPRPTA